MIVIIFARFCQQISAIGQKNLWVNGELMLTFVLAGDRKSPMNTWSNSWLQPASPPVSINPFDAMSQDELLILWESKKKAVTEAKADEMELRKYIVSRAFPQAHEGTNTLKLENGYNLKAGVKFNYNLETNEIVEKTLDEITAIGNEGSFIAERLVSWTPSFLLTEFRVLQERSENNDQLAIQILKLVQKMLIVTDAAPTLEIKEPKGKKK